MEGSCKATTRLGSQCSRSVGEGEEYCWQHKPTHIKWFKRILVAGFGVLLGILAFVSNIEGVLSFAERLGAIPPRPALSEPPSPEIEFTISPPTATLLARDPTPSEVAPTASSVPLTSTVVTTATPGFCDGTTEFCYYIPSAGESWQVIASNTDFEDRCAWPLIANVNRDVDGTYRIVGNILRIAGIFVPKVSEAKSARPTIRLADGRSDEIEKCESPKQSAALPCTFQVREGDGLTGLNYEPLAWDYYRGIEKDGVRLDLHIMNANLADGCQATPVLLLPGTVIVIPGLP